MLYIFHHRYRPIILLKTDHQNLPMYTFHCIPAAYTDCHQPDAADGVHHPGRCALQLLGGLEPHLIELLHFHHTLHNWVR